MRAMLVVGLFCLSISGARADEPAEALIEVSAGKYDRVDTPVFVPLDAPLASAKALSLESLDDGRRVAVQILGGDKPQAVWIIRPPLGAGQSRKYRLRAEASDEAPAPRVTCEDDGQRLVLGVGDKTVLAYHHQTAEAPDGIDAVYRRSAHIHPLLTPSGRAVTDDFPPDHAHQHGVFFAWVNTTFDGRAVDFWNQADRTGLIEHAEIDEIVQGPVFAQFRVRLRHSDASAPDAPQPVLDETWVVRTYDLDSHFLVDLESTQRAIDRPLSINEYHYGGMAVRGTRQWFDATAGNRERGDPARRGMFEFTTSDGLDRMSGNHTRPVWVSMSGLVDGAMATLTVMCDATNFRAPQSVRLHPTKPYFCFAPMVEGEFQIDAARAYISRYRFVVRDGALDQDANLQQWHDYAEPPSVQVSRVDMPRAD